MRFLIQEQPYETPLAAGLLRYEQDGNSTGAVEYWQWNSAVSGYRLLRVDVDAREAASGDSYLYHLVVGENGRFERLLYRFYGKRVEVSGTVLFEAQGVTAVRNVKERGGKREERGGRREERIEDEVAVSLGYGFWFPSSVGLSLLAVTPPTTLHNMAVSLRSISDNPDLLFGLFATEVKLERPISEQLYIEWEGQKRTLWLNKQGHVMKMQRGDGLTAVETRYVQYS